MYRNNRSTETTTAPSAPLLFLSKTAFAALGILTLTLKQANATLPPLL